MFTNQFRIFTILAVGLYCAHSTFVNHVEKLVRTNNQRFTRDVVPSKLKCFSCKDCNNVTHNVDKIDCPSPGVCYVALASEDKFFEGAAVRGCITISDNSHCKVAKDKYNEANTAGIFEKCTTCSSTNIGPCNGDPFEIKGEAPVICYKCDDCDHLQRSTPTITCPVDKCCYMAAYQDTPRSKYSTVRGCKRLEVGQTCDKTCEYVKKKLGEEHPNGSPPQCIACQKGAHNNCNYKQFNLPLSTIHYVMCYNCTDCPKITAVTPNVLCPNSRCCYSVGFRTHPGGHLKVERGCNWPIKDLYTCDQTCDYINKLHGSVGVEYCKQCQQDDLNECNAFEYHVPAVTKPPYQNQISCYVCRNCNHIGMRTKSILCDPKCCYGALLRMSIDNEWSAIRGCIYEDTAESCANNPCKVVKARHLRDNRNGEMTACHPCKKGASNKCNDRPFDVAPAIKMDGQGGTVKCYDCAANCDKVIATTPTVSCDAGRCCYSQYVKDTTTGDHYVTRGCGRVAQNRPCPETCRDQKNRHLYLHPTGEYVRCDPCRADECNNHGYTRNPKRVAPPVPKPINCYECSGDNCYEVDEISTPIIQCSSRSCCYHAKMRDSYGDVEYVTRGCRTEGSCKKTCMHVEDDHLWTHDEGEIECLICEPADGNDDGKPCNSKSYTETPLAILSVGQHEFMCYNCESNCNKVTGKTGKVACKEGKVCYIALVTDGASSEVYAKRGCEEDCEKVKRDHTSGTVKYCRTCGDLIENAYGCNINTFHPAIISVSTKNTVACYKCDNTTNNCDQPTSTSTGASSSNTPTVQCEGLGCCYFARVHDTLNGEYSKRGCVESSKNCVDACQLVRSEHEQVIFCDECLIVDPNGPCNSKPYT